ncbi:hypothetical protein LSAT2_018117 [Lamellibrachia satsuma]|nr:hypothetical protein LSAT2_018117 [Lamellibrachia satsuma]
MTLIGCCRFTGTSTLNGVVTVGDNETTPLRPDSRLGGFTKPRESTALLITRTRGERENSPAGGGSGASSASQTTRYRCVYSVPRNSRSVERRKRMFSMRLRGVADVFWSCGVVVSQPCDGRHETITRLSEDTLSISSPAEQEPRRRSSRGPFELVTSDDSAISIRVVLGVLRAPYVYGHPGRSAVEDVTGNYQLDTSPDALTDAGHSATVEASGVASLSLHCHRRRKRRRLLTGVSRQRRAANARERIETLRLASKWIAYLTTVLIRDDQRRAVSPVPGRGGVPESVRDRLMELLHFEIEDFDVVETRSLLSPGVAASDECDSRDASYATCNARTRDRRR